MRYLEVGVGLLLVFGVGLVLAFSAGFPSVLSVGGVDTSTGEAVQQESATGEAVQQESATGEAVQQESGTLRVLWENEPEPSQTLASNHHTPAAIHFRGESYVAVPRNSQQGTFCSLTMLDGEGNVRWRDTIPNEQCTVHAVSDPTIADFDGDGRPEVIAATSEKVLVAYNLTTGEEELRYDLTSYGYSKPIVANLTAAPGPETVVVDLLGGVFVLRPSGETVWQRTLGDARVRQPNVADYDADGLAELAVGQLTGPVTLLERDGTIAWRTNVSDSVSTRWMTSGQLDGDSEVEIAIATFTGHVAALDGTNGTVRWTRDLGSLDPAGSSNLAAGGSNLAAGSSNSDPAAEGSSLAAFGPTSYSGAGELHLHDTKGAAVRALGDGDGDGRPELYPVARNGKLYSLTGANGSVEWSLSLTDESVIFAPPPSLGDVDGDGDPELVAVTAAGDVKVVDPKTGTVVATHEGTTPIRTFPRITDVDGDGVGEILVIYGDGKVVALSYSEAG